ncbi:MAG TPA: fatty acid--CoA ligase, partial [Acidimicrobiales bacterium]|nr:fatty acid--CoA ligase [Acidimicrobiales bacterium]
EVLGYRGVAWVVPVDPGTPPTQEALKDWCRSQLADYKAPDKVLVVDALPRNQMGKVDKRCLVEHLEEA